MKIILGSGIYGLYSALYLAKRIKDRIIVLEYDEESFKRATYINQARVHMGYHYPRSLSTAKKSAHYFNRFIKDFQFAINRDFRQIYATSSQFSWTNAEEFLQFCNNGGIECVKVDPCEYFKPNMCDGAFYTREYTYDAILLRDYFVNEIKQYNNVSILYNTRLISAKRYDNEVIINTNHGVFFGDFIINATYASTNIVSNILGEKPFRIKYELCEIILCEINEKYKNVGITVMDGPFFSIMPFGKTGIHSLTSVTFTPHYTSYDLLPVFRCQQGCKNECSSSNLANCNDCDNKPQSAWPFMSKLAYKYLREDIRINYIESLYSVKPILMTSALDDSRPTVIRIGSNPCVISVLSGKINTVYDLDLILEEVIKNG